MVKCSQCVSCSKIFLCAGNNPVVLKNSTELAEPLFIALIEHACCAFCHLLSSLIVESSLLSVSDYEASRKLLQKQLGSVTRDLTQIKTGG